ncbi:MAG TPA: hypothetical protein VKR27_00980 [Acidimicrobiales bacterium]|nr:hypothetical protein [Acidimicrobiales bacterium]
MGLAALLIAIGSLIATAVGLGFARKASDAANTANQIERDRRHAELRPRYSVSCTHQMGTEDLTLKVQLAGPGELEGIDDITVTILDDSVFRLKQPDASDQIWGPYRFRPGTGPGVGTRGGTGADSAGRVTTSEGMPVGEAHLYALEPTPYPPRASWDTPRWRLQVGPMLRLRIDTSKVGWDPWVAVGELDTTYDTGQTLELT